jgi:DNA gyrase subunit A
VPNLKDPDVLNNTSIIMVTKKGVVKKTFLEAYSRPRVNGINAININDDDELLEARLVQSGDYVVLALRSGNAIRFPEEEVRNMGRNSTGVRGIRLSDKKDEVVGMVIVSSEEAQLLVVSEKGFGKRSSIEDYRITHRGGKGVRTMNVTDKTGALIAMKVVEDDSDDLMIITKNGITIRMAITDIREAGRATQGVRLIRISDGDEIAAVTKVAEAEEEEIETDGEMDDESVENVEEGGAEE